MSNLERAKILLQDGFTCVLVKEEKVFSSKEAGIKPMINFISQGLNLKGFSAADKIVGRAAAFLFVKAGVKEVFAKVLSSGAMKVFEKNNIAYSYETLTDKIINRAGTGQCPMEEAVKNINDPDQAYMTLLEKISTM